jgi:hypothetical protein
MIAAWAVAADGGGRLSHANLPASSKPYKTTFPTCSSDALHNVACLDAPGDVLMQRVELHLLAINVAVLCHVQWLLQAEEEAM